MEDFEIELHEAKKTTAYETIKLSIMKTDKSSQVLPTCRLINNFRKRFNDEELVDDLVNYLEEQYETFKNKKQ